MGGDAGPAAPERARRAYGGVARLGLIVPPTNTVNEAEWQEAAPEGVTIHSVRMPLHLDTHTEAGRARLHDDLAKAASDLAQADVDAIAYGCTAGSLVQPIDALAGFMTGESGRPAVTTAQALVEALRALGIRRLALATPYDERLNAHERDFLEACGFEVVATRGMGFGAGGVHEYRGIARLAFAEVEAFVAESDHRDAEALLVSCTDLPTYRIHARLEDRLGKPVIGSNQATLWAALRVAGGGSSNIRWGCLFGRPTA